MRSVVALALGCVLLAAPASAQTSPRTFSVASADGTAINGQADAPQSARRGAVVFVAGTGMFDRDARLARTGTARDLLFADLAQRMNARGLATVRYDGRGMRYGATGADAVDIALSATSTTTSQREDLAAVYDWTRTRAGLNARCVVFFAHSEGLLHAGRLAASGAPAPRAIIGMGGLLESPVSVIRWQGTERDTLSLRIMDSDGDGSVTTAEVEANFHNTPSSAFDTYAPFIQPDGVWSPEDIARVRVVQTQLYERGREQALAQPDDAPYPNAQTPMARYSWWKSWFTDETTVASQLTAWRVPMILHYGEKDSQVRHDRQREAAGDLFADRATFIIHPNVGHSLGEHALFGPIDETIADQIAGEAARLCD